METSMQLIIEDSKKLLRKQFKKGAGLTSTPLKRFSGPTLENWSENTIKDIISRLQEKYPQAEIEWGKSYLKSDYEGFN